MTLWVHPHHWLLPLQWLPQAKTCPPHPSTSLMQFDPRRTSEDTGRLLKVLENFYRAGRVPYLNPRVGARGQVPLFGKHYPGGSLAALVSGLYPADAALWFIPPVLGLCLGATRVTCCDWLLPVQLRVQMPWQNGHAWLLRGFPLHSFSLWDLLLRVSAYDTTLDSDWN